MGLLAGAAAIVPTTLFANIEKSSKLRGSRFLNADQLKVLDALGETILPATPSSPGASEAKAADFANVIVTDYFNASEQSSFASGFDSIEKICRDRFEKGFLDLDSGERVSLVKQLEKEAGRRFQSERARGSKEEIIHHYYIVMKQLLIFGYLTSEPVARKAFTLRPVPGKFIGCVDYDPGDKATFKGSSQGRGLHYATLHMSQQP